MPPNLNKPVLFTVPKFHKNGPAYNKDGEAKVGAGIAHLTTGYFLRDLIHAFAKRRLVQGIAPRYVGRVE